MYPAKFEAAMTKGLGGNAFTRNILFDQGQGHMKHCPLHHVTYVPAKFEVATANGKEMHYQENTKCCPVPTTSCDLCTSKV